MSQSAHRHHRSGRAPRAGQADASADLEAVVGHEIGRPVYAWLAGLGAAGALSAVGGAGLREWAAGAVVCGAICTAVSVRRGTRSVARALVEMSRSADERTQLRIEVEQQARAAAERSMASLQESTVAVRTIAVDLTSSHRAQLQALQDREQRLREATLAWVVHFRRRVEDIAGAVTAVRDEVARGEAPMVAVFATASDQEGPFADVDRSLAALGQVAVDAVRQAAAVGKPEGEPDPVQLDVLAKVALRLGSQASRVLVRFDALVRMTEDPDALADLMMADHMVTQMRRDIEAATVLAGGKLASAGGAAPVRTVLRESVQEVASFERVRISAPVSIQVVPYVRSGLIHVVAALLDNATRFSRDEVVLAAELADGALVVTVEDRGLGVHPSALPVENELLAVQAPPRILELERMREGRIGHLLVGRLAREYGFQVRLNPGTSRGTCAVVTVPPALLAPAEAAVRAVVSPPPDTSAESRGAQRQSIPAPSAAIAVGAHPSGLPQRLKQPPGAAPDQTGRPSLPRRDPTAVPVRGAGGTPAGPPPQADAALAGAFLTGARRAHAGEPEREGPAAPPATP